MDNECGKRESQRRSKGNGGATKGTPNIQRDNGFKVANELNRRLANVFPDTGEGRLCHAILSGTILDALVERVIDARRIHNPFTQKTKHMVRDSARRTLSEEMWFCELAGVNSEYVKRLYDKCFNELKEVNYGM